MNKKVKLLVVLMIMIVVGLSACGSKDKAKEGSSEDFIILTQPYFEKQQALMMKQAQGQSAEFEEVSKHAKEVVKSEEFAAWKKEVKKLEAFNISKSDKKSKQITELQDALKAYNKIQSDYFNKLAEAKNKNEYNHVNEELEKELSDSQDKFIKILNELD